MLFDLLRTFAYQSLQLIKEQKVEIVQKQSKKTSTAHFLLVTSHCQWLAYQLQVSLLKAANSLYIANICLGKKMKCFDKNPGVEGTVIIYQGKKQRSKTFFPAFKYCFCSKQKYFSVSPECCLHCPCLSSHRHSRLLALVWKPDKKADCQTQTAKCHLVLMYTAFSKEYVHPHFTFRWWWWWSEWWIDKRAELLRTLKKSIKTHLAVPKMENILPCAEVRGWWIASAVISCLYGSVCFDSHHLTLLKTQRAEGCSTSCFITGPAMSLFILYFLLMTSLFSPAIITNILVSLLAQHLWFICTCMEIGSYLLQVFKVQANLEISTVLRNSIFA